MAAQRAPRFLNSVIQIRDPASCFYLRVCLGIFSFLFLVSYAVAGVPEGISRDLARARAAQISDVRYRLSFVLTPHATTTTANEEITFALRTRQTVLLDFRDGAITTMSVNGVEVPFKMQDGHVALPEDKLRARKNTVRIQFTANIAPAGKAIMRYEDRDDGTEYIYTLFVPMDASMAFPCFDQPDLKGRFRLDVTAPENWKIISNTPIESVTSAGVQQRQTTFGQTSPISTYLFAFAAGPFQKVHEIPGLAGLYVRQSQLKRAEAEAPEMQQITSDGIKYLSDFFARPFPFPKYDLVLIPEFAYGGMEHAGATFLNEQDVLFQLAPTHTNLLNRDILLLHELTHQWFGDLTTMRWFDDLWLKEGFAQYMAYQTLASLKPEENIWKLFYEQIKPAAYAIDSTKGTTPIYQEIPNLKDAKSAYGAIVYSKAPGVLKQLAFVLGQQNFRDGLRLYLKEHAYSNAEWTDLVHAFEQASGKPLAGWAEMWIRHRGIPQVDVSWSCDGDRLARFSLSQHDVLGTDDIWPIATQVLLDHPNDKAVRIRVDLTQKTADVPEAIGKPCPVFVFANDQDYAHGRFLLDPVSRARVMERLGEIQDVFSRTLLWGSLWDSVREADLSPSAYVSLAVRLLPVETDESLTESNLSHVRTALHRYMSDSVRRRFVPDLVTVAADKMVHSQDEGLRITWFHNLRSFGENPDGREKLKALLNGQLSIPGVQLRLLDRWELVTALVAFNDPEADAILNAERQRDRSGDSQRYAYIAESARPDSTTKQKYFEDYLHNSSRPEDWIVESVFAFNSWNQARLTEPYLEPALQALPEIKRNRNIFFLIDWLRAFVGGQQSPTAQAKVYQYLQTDTLDKDLRLKILEAVDELDRAVTIVRKFPE
jgi:aminopeptidase N